MRKKRNKQPLKIGYIRGAESFPLVLAALRPSETVLGRPLELIEYVGLVSLRRAFERDQVDFALMDSVEAFCSNSGQLRSGLLIRGCQVRIVVSDKIAQLGGASPRALTNLFHNRILNKALRIGVGDVGGSVELYSMEFVRSVGRNWIEQVHLPADSLTSALEDGEIDGYFELKPFLPKESGEGPLIEQTSEGPCVRREMALVTDAVTYEDLKDDYLQLIASMFQAQERLNSEEHAEEIALFLGLSPMVVATEIEEVYGEGRGEFSADPGVLSSSMAGGLIEPVGQWEVVVSERLKRLHHRNRVKPLRGFVVEGQLKEAMSLLS